MKHYFVTKFQVIHTGFLIDKLSDPLKLSEGNGITLLATLSNISKHVNVCRKRTYHRSFKREPERKGTFYQNNYLHTVRGTIVRLDFDLTENILEKLTLQGGHHRAINYTLNQLLIFSEQQWKAMHVSKCFKRNVMETWRQWWVNIQKKFGEFLLHVQSIAAIICLVQIEFCDTN